MNPEKKMKKAPAKKCAVLFLCGLACFITINMLGLTPVSAVLFFIMCFLVLELIVQLVSWGFHAATKNWRNDV